MTMESPPAHWSNAIAPEVVGITSGAMATS